MRMSVHLIANAKIAKILIRITETVVAENAEKISEVTARMAEIDELIAVNRSRDTAVRKAKFLHTKFESPAHQALMNVGDTKTISRQRFSAASASSGDRNVIGQLQAERATGAIDESAYRQAVGFVGDTCNV
jgi:hypothetical protein